MKMNMGRVNSGYHFISFIAEVNGISGTRADIVAFLRGDDDARLANGWRAELVGDAIRDLVEGRAALTFDGEGRLELVKIP